MFPNQFQAVVADSVVPNSVNVLEFGLARSEGASILFDRCNRHEQCSTVFQNNAQQFAIDTLKVQQGPTKCINYDTKQWKYVLSDMIADGSQMGKLFEIIARLRRCNLNDKKVLQQYVKPDYSVRKSFNGSLESNANVFTLMMLSELATRPIHMSSEFELQQVPPLWHNIQTQILSTAASFLPELIGATDFRKRNATFARPMLILNGELDAKTPSSFVESWKKVFNSNMHYHIAIPNTTHYVASTSMGKRCIREFLSSTSQAPSCLSFGVIPQVSLFDFSGFIGDGLIVSSASQFATAVECFLIPAIWWLLLCVA